MLHDVIERHCARCLEVVTRPGASYCSARCAIQAASWYTLQRTRQHRQAGGCADCARPAEAGHARCAPCAERHRRRNRRVA